MNARLLTQLDPLFFRLARLRSNKMTWVIPFNGAKTGLTRHAQAYAYSIEIEPLFAIGRHADTTLMYRATSLVDMIEMVLF